MRGLVDAIDERVNELKNLEQGTIPSSEAELSKITSVPLV